MDDRWKKKNRYGEKWYDLLAYLAITLFVLSFIFLSFNRHDNLQSYLNDLGAYDQVIWNTLHGDFFRITTSMYDEGAFLAGHFSPILLFFVPFYALVATPKWLLLFQSLSVGLSAVPIYLFSKRKLKSHFAALVILLSYLLNPFLHNALLYDFHETVFAVGFVAWAFYFLDRKKDAAFIVCAILLSISQEHLALLVFMMGLYAFFIQKRRQFGAWTAASSLGYFFLVIMVLMPLFSTSGNLALLEGNAQYGNRYAWLGASLPEMFKNMLLYPDVILGVLLSPDRLMYLFFLILPVFSLALLAWPIIIILPIIGINLLSSNPMMFNVFFYHSAIIIPIVYFSAATALAERFPASRTLRRVFLGLLIVTSLLCFRFLSLVGISGINIWDEYRPTAHARSISQVEKMIPADASLSVQHNLGPHFTQRKKVYRFPISKDEADYILLDMTSPYGSHHGYFDNFGYAIQMDQEEWQQDIDLLKNSSGYELVYQQDGCLIFRKKK